MVMLAAVFVGEENAQIAKFFCWLIAKDRNKLRHTFPKNMSFFDDANRCLSAPNELCYAVTTLSVQAYNAFLSASDI